MVHGVGDHIPGYSTQFLEKLARELKLTSRLGNHKDITLINPRAPDKTLGNLRATHLLNETTGQRLTFYELTWSEITRKEKSLLNFDNSGEYAFRRAKVNDMLKKFSNDTGPSSRPVPLNEVCSIYLSTLLMVRLAARGYYVITNRFAVPHRLSPSPSQNRAGAINAHGSSLEPFHRVKIV